MPKVYFARLVVLCALIAGMIPGLAHAQQSCGGAPIEFDYAPQVCPLGNGSATARYGPLPGYVWATYQWTVSRGTIVYGANDQYMSYTAPADGTVDITLAVTDGHGCGGSVTHTVPVTAQQTADIMTDTTMCPSSLSSAFTAYGTQGSTYTWHITNGSLYGPANTQYVQYIAGTSGNVHLQVDVTNPGGACNGHGEADIPIQTPTATIETWGVDAACPERLNYASVYSAVYYDAKYLWTATHAKIVGSPTEATLSFVPDGTGDVTLTATAIGSNACAATATRTLPLQAAVAPQLTANANPVCPDGLTTVTVTNASEFIDFMWEVDNGWTISQSQQGQATIHGGSSGVTVVKVTGRLLSGCQTSATLRIPVGHPNATVYAPAAVCPYTTYKASVADAGTEATYTWDVTGGAVLSTNGNEVTIAAGASGTVRASVFVSSASGCAWSDYHDTVVGATLTPMIRTDANYCGGPATASVDNASNYATFAWQINNGAIDGPVDGPSVAYHATSSAPVELTVAVTNATSCSGSATANVPVQSSSTPVISVTPATTCQSGTTVQADLTNSGDFIGVEWSTTNAAIEQRSPFNDWLRVRTFDGPATVTVNATSAAQGCAVSGSTTLPAVTPVTPILNVPSSHCGIGSTITASVANASAFQGDSMYTYRWIVKGGIIAGNYGSSVQVQPTSFGDVEITLEVSYNTWSCRSMASATVPGQSVTPPVITPSSAEVCPNGYASASVPPDYMGYTWTVTNGDVMSPFPSNTVYYRANGNGPVGISVRAYTPDGCALDASTTVPLKSITAPSITLDRPEVCPNGGGIVSVPPDYMVYSWSITNGEFMSGTTTNNVAYRANGLGPVTISVQVWDMDNCSTSNSVTVPLKSIAPPVITLDRPEVCPNGGGIVSVPPDYAVYSWSITNGEFMSGTTTNNVAYRANGLGPVQISVSVWDAENCGAVASVSVPLKSIAPPVITLDRPEVCPNGGGIVSVPPDYAVYSWSITNGEFMSGTTTNNVAYRANGLGPVQISVSVWDAENCGAAASVSVPLKSITAPVITLDHPEVCPNGYGIVSVPPDYSVYSWSITNGEFTSGTNTNNVGYRSDGLGPVQISVSVWDAENCGASNSVTVPLKTIPPPVITLDHPEVCPNGGGIVSVPPDYAVYSWSITNGEFVSGTSTNNVAYRAFASGPVTIGVQVWDAANCSSSNSAIVNVRTVATPTITAGGPTTFCAGTGVTLTASEAAAYAWSNGETTQSITVNQSGSYSVTTTDANGCSATSAAVNVTAETPQTIDITAPAAVCEGSTATASTSGSGTFAWSAANATITGGQGTSTITFVANGTGTVELSVTVTSGACSVVATKSVAVNAVPVFAIDVRPAYSYDARAPKSEALVESDSTHEFCGVDRVGLTATLLNASLTYSWSTGQTGPHIEVTQGGTYTLTITNASGCSSSQSATVIMNPAPTVSISGSTTLCPGGSTTLTASGSGTSYLWSNGATTPSITVTQAGAYSVTATANGCSASASATVTEAAAAITAGGPTTFCYGGSVTLTAAPAQSYLWSNGATTQSITVTESGAYSVSETFASGCTLNAQPVVVSVGPSNVTIAADDITACPNQTIHFTSTVTGGSNLTYQWMDGNGATIGSASTLDVTPQTPGYGSVSLRVTDGNGCSVTSQTITYYRFTPVKPEITHIGPTTFCEGGIITLESNVIGTTYLWSNGATTRSIAVGQSGNYTVTVTDGSGCQATSDPLTITVHPAIAPPTITANGPLTFCEGGSVTLTGPNGYAQYSWSTGETTQSIVVSTSRNVSLSVMNADGCVATSDVTVTVNPLPSATITANGPTSFCQGGSVTLTASAASSYLWSNGATTQSITVNASGAYSVTVTNANGCSATSAATSVTVNTPPATPTITANGPTTFCAGGSVTLTASAASSYLWSTGATTQSITVNASGSYSVTVSNASGCSAQSASTSVTVNTPPATPTITANGPTTFCQGGSVTLTASAASSYLWSNGATTQSITVNASDAYSVTVTNASGCTATSAPTSVTVNALPAVPVITASGSTALCPGASVTLTAPAGYTYLWSTGATTQSITVSAPAQYSVTVTNANGCSRASAPVNVTANAPTVITVQPASPPPIPRNTTVQLSVTATGTPTLQYQWYRETSPNVFTAISGATNSFYDAGPFPKKGTNRFRVQVSSSTCTASTVTSNIATVTVN